MLSREPWIAVPRPEPGEIGPDLLRKAQAYLELRCRRTSGIPRPLVEAWDDFYDSCGAVIDRAISVHHLSESDRNDCVQEVWGEIITKLGQFRYDPARGQLRTWISTLVRNKAVDLIRRRARRPQEALSDAVRTSLVDRDNDPVALYERRRLQALMGEALEELARDVPDLSYRVLHLRWFEGRTVREIADALGLTPEQVRFRYHRVKRKLFRLMEMSKFRFAIVG